MICIVGFCPARAASNLGVSPAPVPRLPCHSQVKKVLCPSSPFPTFSLLTTTTYLIPYAPRLLSTLHLPSLLADTRLFLSPDAASALDGQRQNLKHQHRFTIFNAKRRQHTAVYVAPLSKSAAAQAAIISQSAETLWSPFEVQRLVHGPELLHLHLAHVERLGQR